jgi:hypothetical protein
MQRHKRRDVSRALFAHDEFVKGGADALKITETPHKFDQIARFEKHQATIAVMVCKRSERFVAQRHLCAQLAMARLIEDVDARRRHGLIDPTQSVDGDFFDEQLFDLGAHFSRHFVDQGFWRHDASSTSILPRPRHGSATHMRDSERE